jgi:hypothetical protein
MASLRIRYRKREFYLISHGKNSSVMKSMLNFFEGMTSKHCDVVNNDAYMSKCYSPYDQLNNHGALTLVSQNYYHFAELLMKEIRNVTTKNFFLEYGNHFAKNAFKILSGNESLKACFLGCINATAIDNETKCKIFDDLWPMVLNRKVGERIKVYNNEMDSAHTEDGFKNASFRTVLKIKTQMKAEERLKKIE